MNNTFTFFKLNYPSIYDLIIRNENLDYLYTMFDMKDEIDRGKDKETIENQFRVRVIKITHDYLIIRSNHKRLSALISELESYGYEIVNVSGTLKGIYRKTSIT